MPFNLHALLINSLGKNSSSKNALTIAPATMKEQINSLVNGRDKILHKARSSDIKIICQGQQTNVYNEADGSILSHPITDILSKPNMAKIMVKAWETMKKIPSLIKFCGSRSLDICDFIKSMETFSDFVQDIINNAKTKSSILKSVKFPANKSKPTHLQNGGEKPNPN